MMAGKKVCGWLCVILILSLVMGTAVNAEEGTVFHVDNQGGRKGDTVTVPLTIETGEEVGGFEITVYYDGESMEFQGLEQGELTQNGLFDFNHMEEDHAIKIVYVTADTVEAMGTIATLSFTLTKDCGDQLPLGVSDREVLDGSEEGQYIPSSVAGVDETFQEQLDSAAQQEGSSAQSGGAAQTPDSSDTNSDGSGQGAGDAGQTAEAPQQGAAAGEKDADPEAKASETDREIGEAEEEDSDGEKESFKIMIYLTCAVVSILVILGVVVYLLCRKRRK